MLRERNACRKNVRRLTIDTDRVDRFLSADTDSLILGATICLLLEPLDIERRKDLVIHIIGANSMNIDGLPTWEVSFHLLPNLT